MKEETKHKFIAKADRLLAAIEKKLGKESEQYKKLLKAKKDLKKNKVEKVVITHVAKGFNQIGIDINNNLYKLPFQMSNNRQRRATKIVQPKSPSGFILVDKTWHKIATIHENKIQLEKTFEIFL